MFGTVAAASHSALAQTVPDTVKLPPGLNFGSTSFYDGFGRLDSGFTLLNYGRLVEIQAINKSNGQANSAFNHPHIQALASLTQISYFSDLHLYGGTFAISALLPVVNNSAHFDTPGVVLHGSTTGIGDLTWGPMYQAAPIIVDGRPVFDWRFQFLINSPIGHFDPSQNINIGSGYWQINPYIAMTYLPTEKLEFSTRIHYWHGFQTNRLSDPPTIPGLIIKNGQAGDVVWANFTASYALNKTFALGLNGYYIKQITNDLTNGLEVPNSRQEQLYMGPGVHVVLDARTFMNLNVYEPVEVRNTSRGTQLNYQFVHLF
jgi:hypothetical protein